MLIAQGSTVTIAVLLTDVTFPNGVNGVSPASSIVIVNGALQATAPPNAPEIAATGWYAVTVGPPFTNTLGQLVVRVSGTDPNNPAETAFGFSQDNQVVPPGVVNPTGPTAPMAIQRGVAVAGFPFPMYSPAPAQTLLTGLAVSGQRSLDGGAFVTLAGPITEIGFGWYSTPLTAAETNGAMVALRFSSSGAADTLVTIATQPG